MMIELLLSIALSSSGSSTLAPLRNSARGTVVHKVRNLSLAEQRKVAEVARQILRDPESARFRFLPYNGSDDYCGELNARTLFGGYAGHVLFSVHVRLDSKARIVSAENPLIADSPDPVVASALRTICLLSSK